MSCCLLLDGIFWSIGNKGVEKFMMIKNVYLFLLKLFYDKNTILKAEKIPHVLILSFGFEKK